MREQTKICSRQEITSFKTVCRWFEKRFGIIAAEVGNDGRGFEGVEAGYTVKHESPSTHTSIAIGECEIRQLRRWQWARVPPAATPTRIYLIFPFYLFGLLLVEGHSSNPHGSVAIIGEHGGPTQRPAGLPSRSRATILYLRMHLGIRRALSRARDIIENVSQKCLTYFYFKQTINCLFAVAI